MSWRIEANDGSGWAPNGLRFETKEQAENWAADLMVRWTSCRETRVVESEDPVTERSAS